MGYLGSILFLHLPPPPDGMPFYLRFPQSVPQGVSWQLSDNHSYSSGWRGALEESKRSCLHEGWFCISQKIITNLLIILPYNLELKVKRGCTYFFFFFFLQPKHLLIPSGFQIVTGTKTRQRNFLLFHQSSTSHWMWNCTLFLLISATHNSGNCCYARPSTCLSCYSSCLCIFDTLATVNCISWSNMTVIR